MDTEPGGKWNVMNITFNTLLEQVIPLPVSIAPVASQ